MATRSTPLLFAAALGLLATLPTAGAAAPSPRAATPDEPLAVAIVLSPGATMIDFAGPWEVFQDVSLPLADGAMRHPYRLYTVGASRAPIPTSGGMSVTPSYTFADAPTPAIVVVGAQSDSEGLVPWLAAMHAKGATVMSVCTGAFKLARTGLLDGKRATTHHDYYRPFRESFPKVELVEQTRFVESGERLYTAGGLTSGIDLALHMVALQFGPEIAERTALYMEYPSTGWRQGTPLAAATHKP